MGQKPLLVGQQMPFRVLASPGASKSNEYIQCSAEKRHVELYKHTLFEWQRDFVSKRQTDWYRCVQVLSNAFSLQTRSTSSTSLFNVILTGEPPSPAGFDGLTSLATNRKTWYHEISVTESRNATKHDQLVSTAKWADQGYSLKMTVFGRLMLYTWFLKAFTTGTYIYSTIICIHRSPSTTCVRIRCCQWNGWPTIQQIVATNVWAVQSTQLLSPYHKNVERRHTKHHDSLSSLGFHTHKGRWPTTNRIGTTS